VVLDNRVDDCEAHSHALGFSGEECVSYYDDADRGELGLTGIDAPALAAIVPLLLGFPDRARQLMNEALRRSERHENPFWMGLVHMWEVCSAGCSVTRERPSSTPWR
jgi:hypothetical protein